MINPEVYFLFLLLIQIRFEHDKDTGPLEADATWLEGEEAAAFSLPGCQMIQHTSAFMRGLLYSSQIQTAVEYTTLLIFNYLRPSDPRSAVRHLQLFINLFCITILAQENVVFM